MQSVLYGYPKIPSIEPPLSAGKMTPLGGELMRKVSEVGPVLRFHLGLHGSPESVVVLVLTSLSSHSTL